MDQPWVANVLGSLAETTVDLSVPKFRIAWGTENSNETLSQMGMPLAFDNQNADFSKIAREFLYITAVLQKSFVSIDEAGTEAAAAAVDIGLTTAPVLPQSP